MKAPVRGCYGCAPAIVLDQINSEIVHWFRPEATLAPALNGTSELRLRLCGGRRTGGVRVFQYFQY